ncbi:MAG: hypothetical protein KAI47_00305, partial [Deltaproteobacteria bacterium]|nr:hypothetical protein [Deltaproteobacteria bacterium]
AALFHDLPKAGLNDRTLNSIENPEGMATEDRERLTKHWLAHLREFLTLGGLKAETLARVVTLHESQLEFSAEQLYDGEISSLSLFSELICWIDRFDTLTWVRPEKLPITEHEAQRAILARARGDYDPILRLFVKTFGVYPTGSAVRLLSGEIAIVVDQGGGSDPLRPIVKVIADRRGRAIDGPKADLSTQPKYGIHSSVLMSQLDVNAVALFSRKLGTSSKSL